MILNAKQIKSHKIHIIIMCNHNLYYIHKISTKVMLQFNSVYLFTELTLLSYFNAWSWKC